MKKLKYILPLAIFVFLGLAGVAFANPLFFASSASTSTATTTPVYLAQATAIATTTGPVYDSYEVNGVVQQNQSVVNAPNTVSLAIQFTGSSTASVLGWRYEYSQDAVDWYSDDLFVKQTTASSTDISLGNTQTWTFASSTVGAQPASATNNLSSKIVTVAVPTRYVRAVFYILSSTRGGVWATFIPLKEQRY